MSNNLIQKAVFNPTDRELVESIKKAACEHFDITQDRLITDSTPTVANIRFLCFWLIDKNTEIKDYMIGRAFDKARGSVLYGIDLIDVHKKIYRQTLDNLRSIARIANNFEKNYTWHIQPINTNS